MYRIEKKTLVYEFFFKLNNYFFSTGTATTNKYHSKRYSQTTNKLDDSALVAHLSGLQVLILELQANSMTVYR